MYRSNVRVLWFSFLAFAFMALVPDLMARTNVPAPTIVQPPDGFFLEGSVLDVVVRYETPDTSMARRASRTQIQLVVDGAVIEERPLRSDAGVNTFSIPINRDDPIGLIQVCIGRAGSQSDDRECRRVRAAGPREFDRMRRSLEEMNQIADAVVRYSVWSLFFSTTSRRQVRSRHPTSTPLRTCTSPCVSHFPEVARSETTTARLPSSRGAP